MPKKKEEEQFLCQSPILVRFMGGVAVDLVDYGTPGRIGGKAILLQRGQPKRRLSAFTRGSMCM
jgi:hypothetical protein